MKNITLPIVIEADSDGYFVSCPALQGCYSQGDTYEEAVENIKDAIRLHIADRIADGEEIPQVSVSLPRSKSPSDDQAPALKRPRDLFCLGKTWIFHRALEWPPHNLQEHRRQTRYSAVSRREDSPSQSSEEHFEGRWSDCRRVVQTTVTNAHRFDSLASNKFSQIYAEALRKRLTTRCWPNATMVSKSGGATACPTIATRHALISNPAFTPAASATARDA